MEITQVSNNIRKLRFLQGELTQSQLASAVGVSRQTIISLEANKYNPSLLLAVKLARFFEVPVEEVFQFEDKHTQMPT